MQKSQPKSLLEWDEYQPALRLAATHRLFPTICGLAQSYRCARLLISGRRLYTLDAGIGADSTPIVGS